MTEYKGEQLILSVTEFDIPATYTREHQDRGIHLWLCGECYFHNWQESDKCQRCGEER